MPELQAKKSTLVWQLTFEGPWPTAVAFVGSSRRVAAGNRDGMLLLWDLPETPSKEPPPPVRKLDGHTNGITRLLATPDGKQLISASLDHSIRFWDPQAAASGSAEIVLDIDQREQEVRRNRKSDALSRPGIKVPTQSAQHVLNAHADWVKGLGLSRDGKRLISGDDACLSIVWELATRKEIARWSGYPGNWVTASALSPDGKTAFVGEYRFKRGDFDRPPAQARLYDASTGKEKLDFLKVLYPKVKKRDNSYGYASTWSKFVAGGLVAAEFSPDGKLLALAQGGETGTGKVHLMDTASGKLVRSVSGHQYGVTDLTFSADGKYVLSAGRDTSIRICQVSDGKQVGQLGKPRGGQFKDWFHALSVSADQQWVAAADISGKVLVWKLG